jgi:hypothetical protein
MTANASKTRPKLSLFVRNFISILIPLTIVLAYQFGAVVAFLLGAVSQPGFIALIGGPLVLLLIFGEDGYVQRRAPKSGPVAS